MQTFRLAVARLPNSSLIQALQARFYGVFKGDAKLMLSHYMQVRGEKEAGRRQNSPHHSVLAILTIVKTPTSRCFLHYSPLPCCRPCG